MTRVIIKMNGGIYLYYGILKSHSQQQRLDQSLVASFELYVDSLRDHPEDLQPSGRQGVRITATAPVFVFVFCVFCSFERKKERMNE
jgi:hypothetical protein